MIPGVNAILNEMLEHKELPSKTYKINAGSERIAGYTDELEAVKQAVFFILNTERYQHVIYSWNYGVEFTDLMGRPAQEILTEIQLRITDALLQDSRIMGVDEFSFDVQKGAVNVSFEIKTIFGDTKMEKAVNI